MTSGLALTKRPRRPSSPFRLCRQLHKARDVLCRDLHAARGPKGIESEQAKILVEVAKPWRDHDRLDPGLLPIFGIGQCKGAGRIQFFHHFSALAIDSTYRSGDDILRRQLRYSEPQKQIDPEDFETSTGSEGAIGTIVRLEQFKDTALARIQHLEPPRSLSR
ncbi:hypothetical protein ACVWXM_003212 [Bradyrhizobium sp. GM7.3]